MEKKGEKISFSFFFFDLSIDAEHVNGPGMLHTHDDNK